MGKEATTSEPTVKRDKVASTSGDILEAQIAKLRTLFPEVVLEGKIDFDKLRSTLGASVEPGPGRFNFTWAGKDDAVALLQTPSRGTLIPYPQESVNFDKTGHAFIEGDNLEVLKLLFKPYFGRVKLIYIDPPYNKLKDYIYPDNLADPLQNYLVQTRQVDDEGNLLTNKVDRVGRIHSGWLSMMYPRLFLARQLLTELGAIFVSIDDDEVHHLRMLLNEIFGEENFVGTLVWERSKKGDAKLVSANHEYILVYARDKAATVAAGKWRRKKPGVDEVLAKYDSLADALKNDHTAIGDAMRAWYLSLPPDDPKRAHAHYKWSDDRGLYFAADFAGPDDGRKSRPRYDIIHPVTGKSCKKPATGWRWDEATTLEALAEVPPRIHFGPDETTVPNRKSYLKEIDSEPFASVFYKDGRAATLELEELIGNDLMDFPKNVDVLKEIAALVTDEDSLVLDFFAGSCPIAQAVLELNKEDGGRRRFVVVQLPQPTDDPKYHTIAEIGKERIRAVIGRLREQGTLDYNQARAVDDLGFKVFKLARPSIQQWIPEEGLDPDTYAQKLTLFNDPLIAGWTAENVIWEVALREGFGLNTEFQPRVLPNGNRVHVVSDPDNGQEFSICLDDKIRADISKHCELKPDYLFVCRDVALDDSAAANLALQCRLKTI
ncbi:MAG TPA: DNA methyltransferase [Tepidisphaeraceae bacterium]|jgi:adenine-specific DNA-methyltransferase|nr:DNA methyltransferase [Tepidisphaeraceae bacterium]